MKLNISGYFLEKCRDFAEAQLKTSKHLYRSRGENRVVKIVEDIIVGKLGEVAVYKYLTSRGYEISKPDFNIYRSSGKSFDADLMSQDFNVHVKSQGLESVKRYGSSWLLQKNDRLVSDPGKDEFIAFVNVDLDTLEAEILGIVKAKTIIDCDLVGECRVPRYRDTKVALYWSDIKDNLNKLWELT